MESLNSYYGLAENDYLYAKAGMSACTTIGNYNGVVAGCAQSAEEYFKAVVELAFNMDDADAMTLLHSHNLRALYNKVLEKYTLNSASRDCKWLGDFYFDARYPGDNFIKTNEEDAKEALRILEVIRADIDVIMKEIKASREESKASLNSMKAFKE